MAIFGRKKEEEDYEEEGFEDEEKPRRIRDLKPENKRKRKEPPKLWGKKERFFILFILLGTILTSAILAMSARAWKLPGFPRLSFSSPNLKGFSIFKEETITIGGKGSGAEKQRAEEIKKRFKEKTNSLSGLYALYVVDLKTGFSFGVNEGGSMQAASLIKLPTLAALYKEAQAGNIDLETKYSLKNSDKRSGSGSLSGKPAGTILSYRDLARFMGKESDNTAFNIVRGVLGDEKINSVAKQIGMNETDISKNKTTPKDIGTFFGNLWNLKIVNQKSRDEILGYLTDTIYENWISAGIPDDIRVAHKYGRETHVVNDAGIIFAKGKPFILVIMGDGVVDREADEVFPSLAALVYDETTK